MTAPTLQDQLKTFARLIEARKAVNALPANKLGRLTLALAPVFLEALKHLKVAAHALETPGDFSPEDLEHHKAEISAFLARLETERAVY